ncbi:MAG: hypothetical protein M9891_02335 [Austwickia sp.]|nr:hypothetical protein [Actinomycetota bacterium]MCB1254962.1 hypothetical protein [Austwickia sp.]MCO5308129.1 hypothetical protein [Austwickia sp.]
MDAEVSFDGLSKGRVGLSDGLQVIRDLVVGRGHFAGDQVATVRQRGLKDETVREAGDPREGPESSRLGQLLRVLPRRDALPRPVANLRGYLSLGGNIGALLVAVSLQ